MKTTTSTLLMSAGWLALTCASAPAAFAQQAPAADSAAQAAPAAEEGKVEEVVVTAQFRRQNLQRTPIAITAVSGEMLAARSQGIEIEYGDTDKMLKIQNIENFDWSGWDMAIFAIGSEATQKYAPIAAAAGCVVIDNSSLFRMDPDVPLIVPEVNPDAIDIYKRKNII
eukprot:gene39379-53235_t